MDFTRGKTEIARSKRLRSSIRRVQGDYYADVSPENDILSQIGDIDRVAKLWSKALNEIADKRAKAKKAEKSEGVKYSQQDNVVIDLSNDTELARRLDGLQGSDKYKAISKYILDTIANHPITLSDGTKAVVDKTDARHIASNAASKKTAQIAKIQQLIETAKLFAIDDSVEHGKFDLFKYYAAPVRYDGETSTIYLNVGHGKYDHVYHLYDITQKLRDTARRINGVERARSSRSENGTSISIMRSRTESVKGSEQTKASISDREYIAKRDQSSIMDKDFRMEQKKPGSIVRTFKQNETTANVIGSSVELEGGSLLNRVFSCTGIVLTGKIFVAGASPL